MEDVKKNIEKYFEEYLDDLRSLIAVKSLYNEDKSGKPFGKGIDDALRQMISICDRIGFKTYYDPDGYYGYAEIGEGSEILGILGHVDVVSEGDIADWNTNPYELTIEAEKLYGRGVQDDKGPTLASIYAARILNDLGYSFKKRVRFIFGCDEETLWRSIKVYVEKEEIPSMGFSPDSKFPLIYAEKGLLQLNLVSENKSGITLKGGDGYNIVPAKMRVDKTKFNGLEEKLNSLGFDYTIQDQTLTIIGKNVHAQIAEQGVNAISRLLIALKELGYESNTINFVAEIIKEDAFAREIFGDVSDEASGELKFNIGKIDLNEKEEKLMIDIRIPVQQTKDFIVERIQDVASKFNLEFVEHDYLRSIYVPKDSELIQELMGAYQAVTNDLESEPISSGGATYARAIDNCVAFGAVLNGSPKTEHQPNEYMSKTDLKTAMEIYIEAIKRLSK